MIIVYQGSVGKDSAWNRSFYGGAVGVAVSIKAADQGCAGTGSGAAAGPRASSHAIPDSGPRKSGTSAGLAPRYSTTTSSLLATARLLALPVNQPRCSCRSCRAASTIAHNLPKAPCRVRYFIPQSGAKMTRLASTTFSARTTRALIVSTDSTSFDDKSRTPSSTSLSGSASRIWQSRFDCAVSMDT